MKTDAALLISGLLFLQLLAFGCTQPLQPLPSPIPTLTPTQVITPTMNPTNDIPPLPTDEITAECVRDSDCKITGCSGQVCAKEDVITTCEYRPDYACYKTANCGCNVGKCGWAQTTDLVKCIQNAKTTINPTQNDGGLPPLPV